MSVKMSNFLSKKLEEKKVNRKFYFSESEEKFLPKLFFKKFATKTPPEQKSPCKLCAFSIKLKIAVPEHLFAQFTQLLF